MLTEEEKDGETTIGGGWGETEEGGRCLLGWRDKAFVSGVRVAGGDKGWCRGERQLVDGSEPLSVRLELLMGVW